MLRWHKNQNQMLQRPKPYDEAGTCTETCEDVQFNAFEILRIAEEVEHKATRFFLQAARRFEDQSRRDVCYNLAEWRASHRHAWARIRRKYSERTGQFGVFDPDNYLLSNPQVMASLTCFATHQKLGSSLTGRETAEQIVRDAIRRTRGVGVFYEGLKGFVHDPEGCRIIDAMIDEERRHIRLLSAALDRMQPTQSELSLREIPVSEVVN